MGKIAIVLLLLLLAPAAGGEDVSGEECVRSANGIPELSMLFDMDMETSQQCGENAVVRLYREEGIAGLYLVFDREYDSVTLELSGRELVVSTEGMLHDYLDVAELFETLPQEMTLTFSSGPAELGELRVFSPGEIPDWVQRWRRIPEGKADLLLLSAHGDDEQLFFAGLLPWYAGEKGYRVQVVYLTDHRNMTSCRVHEMLDGLWAVGVRDYPVFGSFDDYYTFDLADAYRYYEAAGHPRRELLAFVTEQLRRYRPLVAVTHDPMGEYGHGMHQMAADLLMEAVKISSEPDDFPEQDEKYGCWLVPKTYLHLYGEGEIVMDWDIPMEHFGGMTAYQVTKSSGFPSHVSQQKDFAWYFRGADRAAEVEKYSPCRYGLYQTAVGEDMGKGDFFEHLEDYRKEPPPTQPTLPIQESQPLAPQPSRSTREEQPKYDWERCWILLPTLGTALLTLLTACLSNPDRKNF